jgi:hypothetical protein
MELKKILRISTCSHEKGNSSKPFHFEHRNCSSVFREGAPTAELDTLLLNLHPAFVGAGAASNAVLEYATALLFSVDNKAGYSPLPLTFV